MKRLIMLAVLCTFVLSAAAASAVDVTTSGNLLVNAVWRDNWEFTASDTPNYDVFERADLYFTGVANENLKGVLGFRSDKGKWGEGAFENGTPGGSSGAKINIRDAYIDFNWPDTDVNVRAGVQPIALPGAVAASMIQDDRGSAAFVTTPITDGIAAMLGYARLDARSGSDAPQSELDAWVLAVPMDFEGMNFKPFAVYAPLGRNFTAMANDGSGDVKYAGLAAPGTNGVNYDNAYWLGLAFEMDMLDPIVFKADLNYGAVQSDRSANERDGWLFDFAVDYTGMDIMTPSLYFAYTSGEDKKASDGSERLPVLAGDWSVGSFFFGGDSITSGSIDDAVDQNGFWLLGLSLLDIQSFTEGLTHSVHFIYAQGTNHTSSIAAGNYGTYLTTKDKLYEVSNTNAYKIYDALTLYVDLGYLNLDAEKKVWGQDGGQAFKFSTGMVFKF